MLEHLRKLLLALFWLAAFGMPVAFLFAPAKASLKVAPIGELYASAVQLVGEPAARILTCSIWLVFVGLLFRRTVISRRPTSEPFEGLAD